MSERSPESRGTSGEPKQKPVPRDLPDQQATGGEQTERAEQVERAESQSPEPEGSASGASDREAVDTGVPDTDEAGTGRRGAPDADGAQQERPGPDEPSG